MAKGLHFHLDQERVFAGAFAQRFHAQNRKTLLAIHLVLMIWILWMGTWSGATLSDRAIALAGVLTLAALGLASLFHWRPARPHLPLWLGFYALLLQIFVLAISYWHPMTGVLPQVFFPVLMAGVLFRLRFVYVLPFTLLIWMLQFFGVNFLMTQTLPEYTQWIAFCSMLMLSVLVVSYQFEQESRRLHLLALQRHRPPNVASPS